MNVYPFIEAEKQGQGCVRRACVLLSVSRAAYYAWSAADPEERRRADDELLQAIKDAHKASRGTYGAPRITRALRKQGRRVSRKRVARLMRQRGIVGRARRRRKRTTIADPAAAKAADLLKRNFTPASHAIDAAWCSDISYVRTWEGWTYLATVIDLSSRRVVGLAMADHLRTSLVSEALEMALAQRRPEPGLIFHTDRGCQYTSGDFRGLLARHKIVQSLSRPGQCFRQRRRRELLRDAQGGAHLPGQLADTRRCPPRDLRVRRGLLQPPADALRPRLSLTSRLRSKTQGSQRGSGSVRNVSVRTRQPHLSRIGVSGYLELGDADSLAEGGPMGKKIVDAHANKDGDITAVRFEGNTTFTQLDKAIGMADRGEVDNAHAVHPKDGRPYLRTNPDSQKNNNLDDMAGDK